MTLFLYYNVLYSHLHCIVRKKQITCLCPALLNKSVRFYCLYCNILCSQICAGTSTKVKALHCTTASVCLCVSEHVFVLVGCSLRDWESQESLILAIGDFSTHMYTHKHTCIHAHSYQLAQWTIMMCVYVYACACVCVCAFVFVCADEGIPVLPWQR